MKKLWLLALVFSSILGAEEIYSLHEENAKAHLLDLANEKGVDVLLFKGKDGVMRMVLSKPGDRRILDARYKIARFCYDGSKPGIYKHCHDIIVMAEENKKPAFFVLTLSGITCDDVMLSIQTTVLPISQGQN